MVFLDAPTYRNFGDSLIWEGSLQYLRDLDYNVVYTADIRGFRDEHLRKVPGDAALILNGGGNLGDLWPSHEKFRRHVVQTQTRRRIIVMPQSIHFESIDSLRSSVDAYRAAQNLTLLLRESRSMQIAASEFSGVEHRFCYDAALGVRVPERSVRARGTQVVVARSDKEATLVDQQLGADGRRADWEASPMNRWLWDGFNRVRNCYAQTPRPFRENTGEPAWLYSAMRRLNIAAAVRQLDNAKSVATNRLHAHVLASLLGIPHAVSDNSYGKISGIFDEYTGTFSTAHWASCLAEAREVAHRVSQG